MAIISAIVSAPLSLLLQGAILSQGAPKTSNLIQRQPQPRERNQNVVLKPLDGISASGGALKEKCGESANEDFQSLMRAIQMHRSRLDNTSREAFDRK